MAVLTAVRRNGGPQEHHPSCAFQIQAEGRVILSVSVGAVRLWITDTPVLLGGLLPRAFPESTTSKSLVVGLNYYTPYVSGLTNSARDIAEGLVRRGWKVTVVAAQHSYRLPEREVVAGVQVIRVPKVGHIGKGIVAPRLPGVCARYMRRADVALLHLPMAEAGLVASLLRRRTPLVAMYHCDVHLPESRANQYVERAVDASSRLCIRRCQKVVVTSSDYIASSRIQSTIGKKQVAIPPPAHLRPAGEPSYRDGTGPHVGFLGRLVEEKGIPYLIDAFQRVAGKDWRLLIGGDYEAVAGGSVVREFTRTLGEDPRIRLLGFIPDARMSDFYSSLDVFAFPSVNPLEAFGIAQVEAMFSGVPVVASDLPGVRQPVLRSGFGRLAPPKDVAALSAAILDTLEQPLSAWNGMADSAQREFGIDNCIDAWDDLLRSVMKEN